MRKIIKLMDDWRYTGLDQQQMNINLQHTWNNVDGQDGGNDYKRGTCIYEKELSMPDYAENQDVYLQFHGVNASAIVYFN